MTTRIGIPPGLDVAGALRAGRLTHYLDVALSHALHEEGALPVGLLGPVPRADGAAAEADALRDAARVALANVDGLLVPGGDDFVPDETPPEPLPLVPVAPAQLAWDAALVRHARAEGMPVLGLCYGMQLLARLAGGRLIHHLPRERPGAADHRLAAGARHPVRVTAGSLLARLLDAEEVAVNSRHHQAVAEPGAGLRVCARSSDGIVEALEGTGAAFVLGVQWHPEDLDAAHRHALLGGFVAACAAPQSAAPSTSRS